jgi:hypothetical protein
MIENKFSEQELTRLLSPFIDLKSPTQIIADVEELLTTKLESFADLQTYTRQYKMTYKGMTFFVYGAGIIQDDRAYISLSFKLEKRWWHLLKSPAKAVLEDLKRICKQKIFGLTFSEYNSRGRDPLTNENLEIQFYYQTGALNKKWEESLEISSLLISPSSNEKYFFLEFYFNPNCYSKSQQGIKLASDWDKHVSDVVRYIEREADRVLGLY